MREIRFFHTSIGGSSRRGEGNHWAGTSTHSAPPFWVIRMVVEGPVDPRTGYVCDIKLLDGHVLAQVVPRLAAPDAGASFDSAARAIQDALDPLADEMPARLRLRSLQLQFSPYTSLTLHNGDVCMTVLAHSFEFSASHRLHCPGLTDLENLRLFGKCSNPHGHGHNYVLEVAVEVQPGLTGSTLADLDGIVRSEVIDRFDHKNLNVECPEFTDLNPTVENIAQVIFDRLVSRLKPIRLSGVKVWETPKTYAECLAAVNTPKVEK